MLLGFVFIYQSEVKYYNYVPYFCVITIWYKLSFCSVTPYDTLSSETTEKENKELRLQKAKRYLR